MIRRIELTEPEYELLVQLVTSPGITVQLALAKIASSMTEKILTAPDIPVS